MWTTCLSGPLMTRPSKISLLEFATAKFSSVERTRPKVTWAWTLHAKAIRPHSPNAVSPRRSSLHVVLVKMAQTRSSSLLVLIPPCREMKKAPHPPVLSTMQALSVCYSISPASWDLEFDCVEQDRFGRPSLLRPNLKTFD